MPQVDVREYAATRGISTEEAARELGDTYQGEPAPAPHPSWAQLGQAYTQPPAATVSVTITPEVLDAMKAKGYGHNSGDVAAEIAGHDNLTQAARDKLKQVVARIERVEEDQKELANQKRDIYGEAKAMGYDTKTIRRVIQRRKMDRQEREEQEMILDVYETALGDMV